jgi:hypothetical protein
LNAVDHNYVILKVSRRAFEEIKTRMQDAGLDEAFYSDANDGEVIDMHGTGICLGILPDIPPK